MGQGGPAASGCLFFRVGIWYTPRRRPSCRNFRVHAVREERCLGSTERPRERGKARFKMRVPRRSVEFVAGALFMVFCRTVPALADAPPVPRSDAHRIIAWTLGAAGGSTVSSGYLLKGTLGQTSAVGASTGGQVQHVAGFWAACGDLGVVSVSEAVPLKTMLHPGAPNPFNPLTILRYELAEPAYVSLAVYDLRGRLVRILVDETKDAGRFEAAWDGRDARGRVMASGTYCCRIETEGYSKNVKMLLVK